MIDPAMCRPGRLDKLLYVDLPGEEERVEIVRTMLRKVPLRSTRVGSVQGGGERGGEGGGGGEGGEGGREETQREVERVIREHGEGYSGADLAAVVREAGVLALRKTLGTLEMMESASSSSTSAMHVDGTAGFTGEGGKEKVGEEDVDVQVGVEEFIQAMEKVPPSVSRAQRRKYEALRAKFAGMPVGGARARGKAVDPGAGIDLDDDEGVEGEGKGKEVGEGGEDVAA